MAPGLAVSLNAQVHFEIVFCMNYEVGINCNRMGILLFYMPTVFIVIDLLTVIQCGGLANPMNGIVEISSSRAGGVVTYTCNAGYEVAGEAERMCLCTGQWSGTPASCQGMCTYKCHGMFTK